MDINKLLTPAAVFAGSSLLLLAVRTLGFRLLQRWAGSTETKTDDIVIKSLKTPSLLWCVALGLYSGLVFSDLADKHITYISKVIHVIVIFSITMAAANLAGRIFRNYIQKSDLPVPTTGLAFSMLKGTIILIGILIILSVLGISITPLITALGVGGLAVALALQDTLANLFAGIHIIVERSIRIGDFIRLETGQEGYVDDITWRTTRIKMLPNNMVVIPNSKLSQSIVTNYYLPEKRMACSMPINVSYSSDPEHVEKILLEEVQKAVDSISGLLSDPAPAVRFTGFGESSLDFSLICHVGEFVNQFSVQNELRKRIFKRFREEGVEVPFPQRIIHMKQDRG
ncbi:MAG: mechanosensitive ion channel family protein [Dissulfurispiraceae bacterium]|nr:mechanosensitive ion channel family protein [Dissulfurispiraceae bacterium]